MSARRRSRSSGGNSGGAAALFGILLVVGLIVKFFWWLVAGAAAVGLFFAARALTRHVQERRAVAKREAEEIAYRADRQNRMAQRGDARGVYGVEGAELMRDFTPGPPPMPPDGTIAGVANTAAELTTLLADSHRVGDGPRSRRSWCSAGQGAIAGARRTARLRDVT